MNVCRCFGRVSTPMLVLVVASLFTTRAVAQTEPMSAVATPVPVPAANVQVARAAEPGADPGWAFGAGVFGVATAIGTLSFALASELTKDEQIPSLPLGVVGTVLVAVSGPVTAIGAATARDTGNVRGSRGLRVTGWIAYGLTLVDASILIVMGVNEIKPFDGLITTVGALGATSLLAFSADAFMSAGEAKKEQARYEGSGVYLAPAVGWVPAARGRLLPVLGVRGLF